MTNFAPQTTATRRKHMRKLTLVLTVLCALVTASVGQAQPPIPNSVRAISYGSWSIQSQGPNNFSFSPTGVCYVTGGLGSAFFPFATNAPVFIQDQPSGSNNERVTPSAITTPGAAGCGFTGSPSHSHSLFTVSSGTGGLQEALNQLSSQSTPASVIVLDRAWYQSVAAVGGTASVVIGTTAKGSTGINLVDTTTSPWTWYAWSGSAYVASTLSPTFANAGNGSSWTYFVNSELVTLATGAQTTDSTANLLPANSIIDIVQGVVNTTITSACTGWELGDPTTAARFTANDTTLTAGEAVNGKVHITTGIASATTGMWQAAAAKVRITCAGGNPGAGKIRVVVYGRTFSVPTS
jgi:hypothetical protein